jgi:hypothetical protein
MAPLRLFRTVIEAIKGPNNAMQALKGLIKILKGINNALKAIINALKPQYMKNLNEVFIFLFDTRIK